MIRALVEQTFDSTKKYYVLYGLSTDTKPTSGLITGSEFHEVDTGTKYEFDEVGSEWNVAGITSDEIKDEIDAWLDDHPEATTTVLDGAISYAKLDSSLKGTVDDVGDLKTEIQTKANVDGSYSSLTAGNAEQLVSTVGVNDKTPYLFRTTGCSADVGDRVKLSEITGGTVAWNQLLNNEGKTYTYPSGASTLKAFSVPQWSLSVSAGHKYLFSVTQTTTLTSCIRNTFCYFDTAWHYESNAENRNLQAGRYSWIFSPPASANNGDVGLWCHSPNVDCVYKDAVLFDLTQMFGSTIADYIYSLEQNTAGAGVAWFRKLFPKDYYAYDAGSLLSVKTSAHKEIGFNQWDEEWEEGNINTSTGQNTSGGTRIRSKNYIPVIPNTTYTGFFKQWATGTVPSTQSHILCYYDAEKNFISGGWRSNGLFTTPSNACYIRFATNDNYGTTYNHDICINLHWDGERDGEYEPYEANTYALDDVELRGIPKLDASNNLYYDGDGYAPDGTVERRYGIVDLGTLNWTKFSGTTTFFYVQTSAWKETTYNSLCSKYQTYRGSPISDKYLSFNGNILRCYDSAYDESDAATFKTAMSGVYLVYELATPTTESADPYQETQVCNDFGTEEFVDERTVPMPVGNSALYQANLRAKLEMAPDSPDGGDNDYIVRQTDGLNEYVAVSSNPTISGLSTRCPACPADTDGTFVLKATVSSGAVTYAWTAE